MSLDVVFVAEFANAGFLMPITDPADVDLLIDGVLEGPLQTAYWDDQLVAAPFGSNAQLLWFRRSVAEEAGVDPESPDFTWDEMIDAAEATGTEVSVQGNRYEGYTVLVNALVTSAGGAILERGEAGADAEPALDSPAGRAAAAVIGRLGRSSAASPALSTADEEASRTAFQGERGGFMVNWPYIYGAAQDAVAEGTLAQAVVDDIGWARYPQVDAGTPSRPPLGGIDVAIGAFTDHPEEALAALRCATSLESQTQNMLDAKNPASRAAVYDDPEVLELFPMAPLIRDSIDDAGPRPVTPYYTDVSGSVQRTWHPPRDVTEGGTPPASARFMREVLAGERLL
jgi:multiple sugar transport system substrate-binding protein